MSHCIWWLLGKRDKQCFDLLKGRITLHLIFYDAQSHTGMFSRSLKECAYQQCANKSTETVECKRINTLIGACESEFCWSDNLTWWYFLIHTANHIILKHMLTIKIPQKSSVCFSSPLGNLLKLPHFLKLISLVVQFQSLIGYQPLLCEYLLLQTNE